MTLKCIAGIIKPDRGKILLDGETLFDSGRNINLTPQERRVGIMFQSYALFPNMTVLQNIRTGARREKDKERREETVKSVIGSFGLKELINRYPRQISGGQQQRVALARMLVSAPRILLLDEPFSALDSHLRFRLEQEVREVIHSFKKTVLLVSHDRDEVFRMADSIAIMNNGAIETFGKKQTVFHSPKTKTGAILTGCKNISALEYKNGGAYAADWGISLKVPYSPGARHIGIRMKDVSLSGCENRVPCRVCEVIENPFSLTLMLRPSGREDALPIALELSGEKWSALNKPSELDIFLPEKALLLLKD